VQGQSRQGRTIEGEAALHLGRQVLRVRGAPAIAKEDGLVSLFA
jgi:hypothetical protein